MPEPPRARLLILDDEQNQMQALCNTLREQGYAVSGFTAAADALSALREQGFDLLLTDLMMPEMNGIDVWEKALKIDSRLVGILMTGQGTIETAVEAMKAGALDYILKPFKLSIILPVISRALAVRQLRLDNAALELRLQEHTAELEAANLELEAYAHSVSHDLRAPLRHIQAYTNMVLEDYGAQLPKEAIGFLNTVVNSARRMGQLTEDLLRLSQLGRKRIAKAPVKVAALVQEVLAELRKDQGQRQIEIQVGELPDCLGDVSLLRQVFVNLLSNAFKFTRQRPKALIKIHGQRKEGQAVYSVCDNGVGFDMQHAQKLFGAFQRMHSADEFEGSGVGLSLVHRVLLRHGGRVWAEAETNKGATFSFSLPD